MTGKHFLIIVMLTVGFVACSSTDDEGDGDQGPGRFQLKAGEFKDKYLIFIVPLFEQFDEVGGGLIGLADQVPPGDRQRRGQAGGHQWGVEHRWLGHSSAPCRDPRTNTGYLWTL